VWDCVKPHNVTVRWPLGPHLPRPRAFGCGRSDDAGFVGRIHSSLPRHLIRSSFARLKFSTHGEVAVKQQGTFASPYCQTRRRMLFNRIGDKHTGFTGGLMRGAISSTDHVDLHPVLLGGSKKIVYSYLLHRGTASFIRAPPCRIYLEGPACHAVALGFRRL
jgi:hypothetical protein